MTTVADTRPQHSAAPTLTQQSVDRRIKLFNGICAGVLIAFALLWLVPIAWTIDTALKPNAETTNPTWAIDNPTLASFRTLLAQGDIWNWYASSFITSTVTAAGAVLTGSMAAFALSRMRFRFRWLVFWFILVGIMIPQQVLIVPQFKEIAGLHLLNTYWAVILPQIPAAIAVFIFKQFFDGIPRDLDEAARVDGAGFFRTYWRVIMPLRRPTPPGPSRIRRSRRSARCWRPVTSGTGTRPASSPPPSPRRPRC
jgi:multiple sugar transport system permease protein